MEADFRRFKKNASGNMIPQSSIRWLRMKRMGQSLYRKGVTFYEGKNSIKKKTFIAHLPSAILAKDLT